MTMIENTPTPTQDKVHQKGKKKKILDCTSYSPDLNPTEHVFHMLKSRLKEEKQ